MTHLMFQQQQQQQQAAGPPGNLQQQQQGMTFLAQPFMVSLLLGWQQCQPQQQCQGLCQQAQTPATASATATVPLC
jgi:hypothetical protein